MTDMLRRPEARLFVRPLPDKPNLEQQRKLAKALARDYWREAPEAVARVQALHPKPPPPADFALNDAQLVIARGYGFASWAKLKQKIDALTKSPAELFVAAVGAGDTPAVRGLFQSHPELITRINEPLFAFKQTAAHVASGNLDLLDFLLAKGADLNVKSSWDKGGFGVLESVTPEQAGPLIARGATVDVWAAANLGMIEKLRALLDADPTLVNAKGGDGKRPLHYARTVEIARLLLERGADIDALDDDHDSTPAQYLVGDRPDVCAFLIVRGARSDLLMATALGDCALVRRHLDENPAASGMRVDQDWFPMIDTATNGGHIYQWMLGFHVSAFDISRKRGHAEVLELLLERAGPLERLLDALWRGDGAAADALLAREPELIERAPEGTLRQVADAARNNNGSAVKAMLARGFSVTARSQHGAMPLHWAAFHGNPEVLDAVLACNPPLEARDRDYDGTAMGWLIHGALNGWPGISTGRHDECVRLLVSAGAHLDETLLPTGHERLDEVLRDRFVPG
jgi:ankyrin repeat protein